MVQFEKMVLENGLRVLIHSDSTTPMAVVNVMYDVGARDENPLQTGFAHLFEHLMFGGSLHIPNYDTPLQKAGGENNAYTSNDLTNFYIQLPAENIETAFWLESDRMLSLAFNEKSLAVQRKVVCEEFKEHYLNKPYGDVWHKLRALAYTSHPYRWMTIGKEISHIENAKLTDVKKFFLKHYSPSNAILVVAGNITAEKVKPLIEKWFGKIPAGLKYNRNIQSEPPQTEARKLKVFADVPLDAFYKCWHIYPRLDDRYYVADLITEVLSGGGSSRLYQSLVKEQKLCSSIDCSHTGSLEAGLLSIEARLIKGVTMETAEAAIGKVIEKICQEQISEKELQKVKNKTESMIAFEDLSVLSRANSLALYELMGDAQWMNEEWEKYNLVTAERLQKECAIIFKETNSNTLYYHSKN